MGDSLQSCAQFPLAKLILCFSYTVSRDYFFHSSKTMDYCIHPDVIVLHGNRTKQCLISLSCHCPKLTGATLYYATRQTVKWGQCKTVQTLVTVMYAEQSKNSIHQPIWQRQNHITLSQICRHPTFQATLWLKPTAASGRIIFYFKQKSIKFSVLYIRLLL